MSSMKRWSWLVALMQVMVSIATLPSVARAMVKKGEGK